MNLCGNTLGYRERIKSKKQLETLFGGGKSRSMAAFPVRLVYMTQDCEDDKPQLMMMVSVSKRHFKHAVDRNRAKRQMREAYRLNKHILDSATEKLAGKTLSMGFIWLSDEPMPTERVKKCVTNLMERLNERITMDK
ncbi:MAG: ribonuclease P protein component [Prevotella sp.]